jgi:hypothetical protein
MSLLYQGRIQDFKLGGAHLKTIAPCRGRREKIWDISCGARTIFQLYRGGQFYWWPGTVKTFIKLYLPESKTEVILTAHTLANSKDIYKTIPS